VGCIECMEQDPRAFTGGYHKIHREELQAYWRHLKHDGQDGN
jgi:hypothetical protein